MYNRFNLVNSTTANLSDILADSTVGFAFGDTPSIDPFGRLRVSTPYTLFDSKQLYDSAPLFWNDAEVSGTGTSSSHSINLAATTMSVSSTTAGTRVRQTKRYFNYQPGKGFLIFLTGVFGSGKSGITKRIGYFNDDNGLYFELSGNTLSAVRRSKASGSVVNTGVAQSNWNIDKLDGSGKSGITFDLTKTQIIAIDFEWLGVGRVRMGFVIDGLIYYVHEFLNANNLSTVYMSSPNLPCRYEISNDGTGLSDSLVHICTSVISEGGQESNGIVLSASNSNTHIDANVAGTLYACIGMKLKSTHLSSTIINLTMSMMGTTTNDNYHWQLLLNPTVGGTFTYNNLTNSALQIAYGSTTNTITGGTLLNSGYASQSTSIQSLLDNALSIGSTIANVSDALVLAVMPVGGASNLDIYASLTWRELL